MSRWWNWKSGVLSVLLHSPIFAAAALGSGFRAATAAGLTDAIFRVAVAGAVGAVIQRLASAPPSWASTTAVLIGVPLGAHIAEALVHWGASTPNWTLAFRTSIGVSIASALFNLHAMRRGAFIAGRGARPLVDDLRRLPQLVIDFLRWPFSKP